MGRSGERPSCRPGTGVPLRDAHAAEGHAPEPYAASLLYFRIFEGVLIEVPALLGLAPATIVTSEITPRTMDIVLELPRSSSIVDRVQRRLRAAVSPGAVLELLEEQRREMATASSPFNARPKSYAPCSNDFLTSSSSIARDPAVGESSSAEGARLREGGRLVGRSLLDFVAPARTTS